MASPIDRSWYQRPEGLPSHESAGGVVARVERQRVYVALIREARRGAYVLPKGHVEPGETVERAAAREIEEEAGLSDLTLIEKLGSKERLSFDRKSWKRTHYFLFVTMQMRGRPTDPRTVGGPVWHPLDKLPDLFWPEQAALLEEHRGAILDRLVGAAPR